MSPFVVAQDTPAVVAVPNIVEFWPLPTNFRYSITVTLRNLTTNAMLFQEDIPVTVSCKSGDTKTC